MKLKRFDLLIAAGCAASIGLAVFNQEIEGGTSGYDGNPFTMLRRMWARVWAADTDSKVVRGGLPPAWLPDNAKFIPLVWRNDRGRLQPKDEGFGLHVRPSQVTKPAHSRITGWRTSSGALDEVKF